MGHVLRAVWAQWKIVARAIGNFQARVVLSLFYFIVVPPFALIVKVVKDPLQLRPDERGSGWVERPRRVASSASARRQF